MRWGCRIEIQYMGNGKKIEELVELFTWFPGIGRKQAERFARFIARSDTSYLRRLTESIQAVRQASRQCPECFIIHEAETTHCEICANEDTDLLIIVEKDIDVHALKQSTHCIPSARFFVFGGLLPIATSKTDTVRFPQLCTVIRKRTPQEVILAFSVHPDAEHTTRHLTTLLRNEFPSLKISTLGRGLSSGSELEYADHETLTNALQSRNAL